ncbi:MAG: RNA repair transcriptional activator RtcR [Pyrinomonadaceae bacterium]
MNLKPNIVIGFLGSNLDHAKEAARWKKWRPTVSICCHNESFPVARLDMLYQPQHLELAEIIDKDIKSVSPNTEVRRLKIEFNDPWSFEEVYSGLLDFATNYDFNPDQENYFIHITAGTHVAQICLFLLTESYYFPGKVLQTSPPNAENKQKYGSYHITDLDFSNYSQIISRFDEDRRKKTTKLKSGIETKNALFNQTIDEIEKVAVKSKDPILLLGPTGTGKTKLAERIYEIKAEDRKIKGEFVQVNCATIQGDGAMSKLFGHVRGSFTGADSDRVGLLKKADKGVLFLDEIGELGLDEQAMLLRAIEEKKFSPFGSDNDIDSDFQLITGTNRDLAAEVKAKRFREDLLARIKLWTFFLPPLKDRREDIEPNIDYELRQFAQRTKKRISFNKDARLYFLKFSSSAEALWSANFRDLNAAINRMATMATGGKISIELVKIEIKRLKADWSLETSGKFDDLLESLLGKEKFESLDVFDRIKLEGIITKCCEAKTLSEAGRILFPNSRTRKTKQNDADRLRKFLISLGTNWTDLQENIAKF